MKKIISLVLVCTLIFPTVLYAEPPDTTDIPDVPRIQGILKGQSAPYSGVLLSTIAAARIFAQSDYSLTECQLRIDFEVEKEQARLQLLLDSTRASLESQRIRYDRVIEIKDAEIKRLTEIASKDVNDYSALWWAGGIATGIALTIGVVYAVK